jgi:hypothetical protein
MPSIEIICIGQLVPLDFSAMPFKVYAEDELISHRTPRPLFQSDFDKLSGCIYHLCNQRNNAYTAGDLLTNWEMLHFKPEYVPCIKQLLFELLQASPCKELLFTSDNQFGPGVRKYKRPLSLNKFWVTHDENKLHFNALYCLVAG